MWLFIGWCKSGDVIQDPQNTDISLHIHTQHIFATHAYPIDEFCIDIKQDKSFTAEVCKKSVEHSKFK